MIIFMICVAAYCIWLIFGIWFFLSVMGDKYREQRWYDWPLMMPVLPFAYLIGWLSKK